MKTKITRLLGIEAPVIQGGMAWVADAHLAAAVSNGGGLGIIAAYSMPPDLLREQIALARSLTTRPFGVNVMMMSPFVAEIAQVCIEEHVDVVTTGAGNPAPYIAAWKQAGITVMPVVPSAALALRMQRAGADAVIAEGTEAGGHIGEITTLCLVPQVRDAIDIPLIAAGGIADGRGMLAALALGADGVQMGTAFVCASECTVHPRYKERVLAARDTGTAVTGRGLGHPVRSLRSPLTARLAELEKKGCTQQELDEAAVGSLRHAVLDGDDDRGSFMAGQSAGLVRTIRPAAQIIEDIVREAQTLWDNLLRERMISFE